MSYVERTIRIDAKDAPTAVWRVAELVPGRAFNWETASGMRISAAHAIEPDGAGSMVTLSIRTRGVLAALFSPLIVAAARRNMDLEAAGLQHRSDERARS